MSADGTLCTDIGSATACAGTSCCVALKSNTYTTLALNKAICVPLNTQPSAPVYCDTTCQGDPATAAADFPVTTSVNMYAFAGC